jgi:hypothetical protein
MKTLLFIVLKVLEITITFAAVYLVLVWIEIFDWLSRLPNWISIVAPVLSITYLILTGFFKDWFKQNKKWVNKILD